MPHTHTEQLHLAGADEMKTTAKTSGGETRNISLDHRIRFGVSSAFNEYCLSDGHSNINISSSLLDICTQRHTEHSTAQVQVHVHKPTIENGKVLNIIIINEFYETFCTFPSISWSCIWLGWDEGICGEHREVCAILKNTDKQEQHTINSRWRRAMFIFNATI